jgi:class 3 adenylate cyclase
MGRFIPDETTKIGLLHTCSAVTRIISGIMIGIMLLFLVPLVLPYFENAKSFIYIRSLLKIEHAISTLVSNNVPTKLAGRDVTRAIVVIGMFVFSGTISRVSERLHDHAEYLKYKINLEAWKEKMKLSDNAIVLTPLNRKLEQMKTAKKKDREQLLREFADTKKKLDEMGRDLTFLSIDVVDSTGMKQGEERGVVEHDFKEYKRFVEGTLRSYGLMKSAWTPDGVMSCFTTVDAAAKAARAIIIGLDAFNKNVKSMRRDFNVRCGVNSGFVYFDDSVPLEEINDRVIDIAGHMQKQAKPNTVCVAKPAIEPLDERNGFQPSGKIVDGYEVYEWRKS